MRARGLANGLMEGSGPKEGRRPNNLRDGEAGGRASEGDGAAMATTTEAPRPACLRACTSGRPRATWSTCRQLNALIQDLHGASI